MLAECIKKPINFLETQKIQGPKLLYSAVDQKITAVSVNGLATKQLGTRTYLFITVIKCMYILCILKLIFHAPKMTAALKIDLLS